MPASRPLPYLGFGLGLRVDHYEALLEEPGNVEWLEIVSENYLVPGGRPLRWLERFRERFPLVMHGVSLSIGGTDPLDPAYLDQLAALARHVQPAWISDHLCWTGVDGVNLHDLMPLPYTEEALGHVVDRVHRVQDRLGRRILLENVSSYISFAQSQLTEWEFLAAVAERADCLILLDINNVYVSAHNHGFRALDYLDGLPPSRVQQFHLAGHEQGDALLIDTHDAPVGDAVWHLYVEAVRRFGRVSTMIERDDHIPPLATLRAELDHARALAHALWQEAA
ncbi:MNIO family bufferin maturase [Dyella japonica]|uniref:MNIO family bufferin maturase n=1 Tax=Dyella japonica TaxID=231455 RepID=UPI000B32E4B3|nr:DUF692 domain-containing protein [Dyella japonica]